MNLDSGPGQMLQRSCDRCHRSKHKCVFSNQQASCVRCLRLGKHCTTRRPRARLGRPATAPDFPSGQAGIFTSLGTSGIDVAQDQSDCLTETGPARSPASSSSHVDVEAGRASAISLSMPHTTFVSLGELYLGDADDFSATHGYFMIGPTFITPFYSVVRWLVTSPSNTEHIGGYLAFLSLIRRLQVAHPSVSTVELMAGANGLRSLQNLGLIRQRNSKEIIGHLLYYALSDTSSCRVMPMMFPLLVAMLEVEGPGEKVIDHISKVNVQVLHTTQLLRFIAFVRYRREQGFRGLWFELAEGYDGCFVI